MRTVKAYLKSAAPLAYNNFVMSPRKERETADAHEERCFRERIHCDADGYAIIPPTMPRNCLMGVAKFLSMQIPGKGKSTYTKHFKAGLMITESITLPIKVEDVEFETLMLPPSGIAGDGKRVKKFMPFVRSWEGVVEVIILDDAITPKVFEHHLREAGKFIGLGRFRPQNGGYYGRFDVTKLEWSE